MREERHPPSPTGRRWDFFISYTAADQGWAEWIAWELENAGYQVLVQAWDFVPGTHWTVQMRAGIAGGERTIAVLSTAYLRSVYGQAEWMAAYREDPEGFERKLVPVRVEDCDRPDLLGGVVSFDLFGRPEEEARSWLLDRIAVARAGRAKPATAPTFPGAVRPVPPWSATAGPVLVQGRPEAPGSEPARDVEPALGVQPARDLRPSQQPKPPRHAPPPSAPTFPGAATVPDHHDAASGPAAAVRAPNRGRPARTRPARRRGEPTPPGPPDLTGQPNQPGQPDPADQSDLTDLTGPPDQSSPADQPDQPDQPGPPDPADQAGPPDPADHSDPIDQPGPTDPAEQPEPPDLTDVTGPPDPRPDAGPQDTAAAPTARAGTVPPASTELVVAIALAVGTLLLVLGLLGYAGFRNAGRNAVDYASGDRPRVDSNCSTGSSVVSCGPDTWSWQLPAQRTVATTVRPADLADARALGGRLHLDGDCAGAAVNWRISVADRVLASGTLTPGDSWDDVTEQLPQPADPFTISAGRVDFARCATTISWQSASVDYDAWWYW